MGRSYKEYLTEKLRDPAFKNAWEEMEPEYRKIKTSLRESDVSDLSPSGLSGERETANIL